MVQEQWVQLKMKFVLSYNMEFLLIVGTNFRWRDTGQKFLGWIFPGGEWPNFCVASWCPISSMMNTNELIQRLKNIYYSTIMQSMTYRNHLAYDSAVTDPLSHPSFC